MAQKKKTNAGVEKKGESVQATASTDAKTNRNSEAKNVKSAGTATVFEPVQPPKPVYKYWSLFDFKLQAIIVALLAFILYINTAGNEFAHDDGIVIVKNEYVQEGFAGIWKICTKDAYDSYYRQLNTSNQLTGGRYRPLSIITFAIEQQFFGAIPEDKVDSFLKLNMSYGVTGPQEQKLVEQMHVRHIFNVLWYVLLAITVLYFLRYIVFKDNVIMAFAAAVLFTIHPIHTEVVANVKSRDEIMSLLFMCLTFIFAFKSEEERERNKKILWTALGMLSFFCAFMSKEYAITIVFLLPMALFLFRNHSVRRCIISFLPYAAIVGIYFYIRWRVAYGMIAGDDATMTFSEVMEKMRSTKSSEEEILNNPYFYASATQKVATEIATSLNYLKLLFFPYPLSADYSYDTIPYKDFGNIWVYISLLVHTAMIGIMGYVAFINKEFRAISFAIGFYILHLLLVCNIIFDIGATMGERLIFHSSLGFSIVIAFFLVKLANRLQQQETANKIVIGFLSLLSVLWGYQTMARNLDWKNDATLFAQDLKVTPNSILVNANVAASLVSKADYEKDDTKRKEILRTAVAMLDKTITLHRNTFVAGFLNRGIAHYKLGEIEQSIADMNMVKQLYPTYPTLHGMYQLLAAYYMRSGWENYGKFGKFPEAITEFKKGIALDSSNSQLWYNLGGAYFSNKQYPEAVQAWQISLRIDPKNLQTQQGLQAVMGMMNNPGAQPMQLKGKK
jgi:protein O-mannosyl-transferase